MINQFPTYTALVNTGSNVRATSVQPQSRIDVAAAVSRVGTGGSVAIARTVVQDGELPSTDFTNTVWTYYIINRGAISDGETIVVGDDGTVTVPSGLVVDSESFRGTTGAGTSIANVTNGETHLTKNHLSELIIFGAVSQPMLTATDPGYHEFVLESTYDSGANWTIRETTQQFPNSLSTATDGQLFNNTQVLATTIRNVPANTTVGFRCRYTGTVASVTQFGFGFGFNLIEERTV